MDSEAVYEVLGLTRTPATPEETAQLIQTLSGLLRGHRMAILHLARQIEGASPE